MSVLWLPDAETEEEWEKLARAVMVGRFDLVRDVARLRDHDRALRRRLAEAEGWNQRWQNAFAEEGRRANRTAALERALRPFAQEAGSMQALPDHERVCGIPVKFFRDAARALAGQQESG